MSGFGRIFYLLLFIGEVYGSPPSGLINKEFLNRFSITKKNIIAVREMYIVVFPQGVIVATYHPEGHQTVEGFNVGEEGGGMIKDITFDDIKKAFTDRQNSNNTRFE